MQPGIAEAPYQNQLPPEAPADEQIVLQQPASTAVHTVIFVGNLLTNEQLRTPLYRLGGRLFPWPDFQTVPNGVVRRCEITRLKPRMRHVHKQNVQEDKWPLWQQSYSLTNQWDKKQQKFVNITYGLEGTDTADFLYKALQPSQEIGMIAYRNNDGVRHLDGRALLTTADEIKGAQLHYFPNWHNILIGAEKLPERIAELEDHLSNRLAAATSDQFRAVGEAFLFSCEQFRSYAREYIDRQTAAIEETKGKGVSVKYDEVAERLFRMCDITREDKMVTNFATAQQDTSSIMAQMAESNRLMAEILASQTGFKPKEEQPPAPETFEDAAAEFERAVEDDMVFADMTAAVAPADPEPVEGVEGIEAAPVQDNIDVPPAVDAELDGMVATLNDAEELEPAAIAEGNHNDE